MTVEKHNLVPFNRYGTVNRRNVFNRSDPLKDMVALRDKTFPRDMGLLKT